MKTLSYWLFVFLIGTRCACDNFLGLVDTFYSGEVDESGDGTK